MNNSSNHHQNKRCHNSMCNGVFSPICEPEVCDIPRMPHFQDLVVGNGTIVTSEKDIEDIEHAYQFTIKIYREFMDYFGYFTLLDSAGDTIIESNQLECYHTKTTDKMVAIFHVLLEDDTSREVTVYAKPATTEHEDPTEHKGGCQPKDAPDEDDTPDEAALYVYSAPLFDEEIKIGSNLVDGEIKIFLDMMAEDHH